MKQADYAASQRTHACAAGRVRADHKLNKTTPQRAANVETRVISPGQHHATFGNFNGSLKHFHNFIESLTKKLN
jgi:hypothetical protein